MVSDNIYVFTRDIVGRSAKNDEELERSEQKILENIALHHNGKSRVEISYIISLF